MHGVLKSIILDRDLHFTSRLWQRLQNTFGSQLKLSSAYHPQTDGQSERIIWTLEDMMRTCILEWKGDWECHLPLVKFAYDNSFHASIGMAPFEVLYERPCRSSLCWKEMSDK